MGGKSEVLTLFRSLLREANKFSSYNVRHYAKRRVAEGYRENQKLQDPEAIQAALHQGKEALELMKRQVLVYSLYQPHVKSIMDLPREANQ